MSIGIADIIDILMVATLLYLIYRLMKASGSLNMFIGILIFISVGVVVSQILKMRLLGSIFDKLLSVGVIALLIIFQEEVRRFFITLGSQKHFNF
ncbi:MAG: TIGR00159 family protein, partial [Bacteroidales bacterium]|nr:TIGR00159 family protein [Bacteroidales bacterium]